MATKEASAIPLSPTEVKLYFINWDSPIVEGLTTVTIDETDYDVLETGRTGNRWVIIDANGSDFSTSRVLVDADFPTPTPSIPLGYGLLYNWYAATDARGIAPSGFRVPSDSDFSTLESNLGGSSVAGGKLKSTRLVSDGQPYWNNPNTGATDEVAFKGFPSGRRIDSNGQYDSLNAILRMWTTTEISEISVYYSLVSFSGEIFRSIFNDERNGGYSIRCVSDSEPLTSTVQDADGNNYSWVQIGSQYWLQQSLKTTTYNNGDPIPTGLDNTAWSNTTDGAYAFPNNDPSLPI